MQPAAAFVAHVVVRCAAFLLARQTMIIQSGFAECDDFGMPRPFAQGRAHILRRARHVRGMPADHRVNARKPFREFRRGALLSKSVPMEMILRNAGGLGAFDAIAPGPPRIPDNPDARVCRKRRPWSLDLSFVTSRRRHSSRSFAPAGGACEECRVCLDNSVILPAASGSSRKRRLPCPTPGACLPA